MSFPPGSVQKSYFVQINITPRYGTTPIGSFNQRYYSWGNTGKKSELFTPSSVTKAVSNYADHAFGQNDQRDSSRISLYDFEGTQLTNYNQMIALRQREAQEPIILTAVWSDLGQPEQSAEERRTQAAHPVRRMTGAFLYSNPNETIREEDESSGV